MRSWAQGFGGIFLPFSRSKKKSRKMNEKIWTGKPNIYILAKQYKLVKGVQTSRAEMKDKITSIYILRNSEATYVSTCIEKALKIKIKP